MAVFDHLEDPYFGVDVVSATPYPQLTVWIALHRDYSEDDYSTWTYFPPESAAGEQAVKRLLAGDRGHYGCLEHPQICFAVDGYPHSVMQQARTHRTGISFDVQSTRYTGQRILDFDTRARAGDFHDLATYMSEVEKLFYLRPVGHYTDRSGKSYEYTTEMRNADKTQFHRCAAIYAERLHQGYSEEHARLTAFPYGIRQSFVVSMNLRTLFHFCDLRCKADAELEIRDLAFRFFEKALEWAPEIADWYGSARLSRARLAP